MFDLDNKERIKKIDKSKVYNSIEDLPKQCQHAWDETIDLVIPTDYQKVNKIVMTGMGGSGLGARVIKSVFFDQLKHPLITVNDYQLPSWVDKDTLVICSSFSGTTEEVIANAKEAQAKNCKWLAIGTGGTLIEMAKKSQVPYYQIDPTYNQSKQPRMAVGYSIIGQLVMASKVKMINFSIKQLDSAISAMKRVISKCDLTVKVDNNPAKEMAKKLFQKKVVFVAASHLTGAVHVFKNQMNENAKNFSVRFDVPELNHHLMEGLRFPDSNRQDLVFLFIKSNLYPDRIQQRIQITDEVVRKNKIKVASWQGNEKNSLAEAFSLIQFGAFVNFYLTMLYGIDPAPIPWVDYFKTKLGQPLGALK